MKIMALDKDETLRFTKVGWCAPRRYNVTKRGAKLLNIMGV